MKNVSLKRALTFYANENLYVDREKSHDILKILKCGILTDQEFNKADHIHLLTKNQKNELNTFIDTFENMRRNILNDFYSYYKKGVFGFLIHCARIKDTSETKFERIKEIRPITTNIKKGNGEYLKVRAYRGVKVKDGSIHKTLYWICEDNDTDDGCCKVLASYNGRKEIITKTGKKERITYEYINAENYEGHKFDKSLFSLNINSQNLSNRLSFFYFSGAKQKDKDGKWIQTNAYKKYLDDGIEIKGIMDKVEFGQNLKESLRTKIAATLTSFAMRLTDTIEAVENAFIEKDRLLDFLYSGNGEFASYFLNKLSRSQAKEIENFKQLTMEEGDLKEISSVFNYQAKECNVIINNILQAFLSEMSFDDIETSREDLYKQLRDEYLMRQLKAIPSFPLLNVDKNIEVTTEDILMFVNSKREKISLDAFLKMKLEVNDYEKIEGLNELTAKLKWPEIEKGAEASIIFLLHKLLKRKRNNVTHNKLYQYAYFMIINEKASNTVDLINNLIYFSIGKMIKIAPSLNLEEYKSDGQSKRVFADYARIIISFLSIAQKKSKKHKPARKMELETDELLRHFKGSVFDSLKKRESSILGLSGFDFTEKSTKKGVVFIFQRVKTKTKRGRIGVLTFWYLGVNLHNQIKFKEESVLEKKFQEYATGKFYALCSKKSGSSGGVMVKELDESNFLDSSKMMLLPLLLTKRQIREYFDNADFSILEQGTYFNSLEIQRVKEDKRELYFLNLAVTRQNVPAKALTPEYQKGLLGVNRGENTVAWAALLDMDGNPLFKDLDRCFIELAPEFGKKYRDRYKEIQESQSRGSAKKLNVKGEIQKVIEQVGARIISEALQNGLKIVLENLDTNFRRKGKGVFVGVSQQYNNLQAFIESKLTQNNISMNRVDGLLTFQFPFYVSILCSNCGNINSLTGKEHLVKDLLLLDEEGELPKELKYKEWSVALDQTMRKWDRKKRKYVVINIYDEIVKVLTNNRIIKKESHIENLLKDLFNPRKNQSDLFSCNLCGHECNEGKQAGLNTGRFSLLPKRTAGEKEKITYSGKIELEYQKRLKSGIFLPGSEFL